MNEEVLTYLALLEDESPGDTIRYLSRMLESDPHISLKEDHSGSDEFSLGSYGSLEVSSDTPKNKRAFFHWWCRQFLRRRFQQFDALTGLYTRSYWMRELKHRLDHKSNWCVVMVDIDHFKRFNDDYGHEVGDRVLQAVGGVFRDYLSGEHYGIRYGGEEFLFLLEETPSQSRRMMDQLREFIADSVLFDDQPRTITVSMGLSALDRDSMTMDEAIRRADRALYHSKRTGRNRLTQYAPHLDRENRYYVWGIYRYLWGAQIRFCLSRCEGRDEFLLYNNGRLHLYYWSTDEATSIEMPPSFTHPCLDICRYNNGFVLLDSSGSLWHCEEQIQSGNAWIQLREEDDPGLAQLIGHGEDFRAVGLDNQLYRPENERMVRDFSLPGEWDHVLSAGSIFVVVQNVLIQWSEQGCQKAWPLSFQPLQATSDGQRPLMVSENGELYRFTPSLDQWDPIQVMNLKDRRISCREVSGSHYQDRLLMRDDRGRLLFIRRGEKSTPHTMNLYESMPDRPPLYHETAE